MNARRRSLVVVGAGPRATGLLERLGVNAPTPYGDGGLDIHLVDPHPAGPGRIWRSEQSPLLWMNSMAEDVTLFTDESVTMAGPVVAGPTLHEWAGLPGDAFADRRTQGSYLRWAYERALAALPPGITVREHRRRALAVGGPRAGRQQVWLEGRTRPLLADYVVLALGHQDAEPDAEQLALAAHARAHHLTYLPPDFTADSDLSGLRAGEPVLVRGLGLAFVDLMVLLTEGRGGRWSEDGRYLPSGREPVLHVGSRRGVPYHVKIGYRWSGERPPLPRFFGPEQTEKLRARAEPLDFRRDVWPLVVKELGWAHYHRLFAARPASTAMDWADFEEKYAAADPLGEELRALVRAAVPDPADRLDLDALDRPLTGLRAHSPEELRRALLDHIDADLARRHDSTHSEDLAVFFALLSVYGQIMRLGDVGPWWHGFFSFLASGPPGPRLRQLRALADAGIVRFLGADVDITAEPGGFAARSASLPGHTVRARALVEARLPQPTAERVRDPLLRGLFADGAAVTEDGLLAIVPEDGRVRWSDGSVHPRLFALGPHTDARGAGAFTRPRTGGPAFRQNDAAARALLAGLRDPAGASPEGVTGAPETPAPPPPVPLPPAPAIPLPAKPVAPAHEKETAR